MAESRAKWSSVIDVLKNFETLMESNPDKYNEDMLLGIIGMKIAKLGSKPKKLTRKETENVLKKLSDMNFKKVLDLLFIQNRITDHGIKNIIAYYDSINRRDFSAFLISKSESLGDLEESEGEGEGGDEDDYGFDTESGGEGEEHGDPLVHNMIGPVNKGLRVVDSESEKREDGEEGGESLESGNYTVLESDNEIENEIKKEIVDQNDGDSGVINSKMGGDVYYEEEEFDEDEWMTLNEAFGELPPLVSSMREMFENQLEKPKSVMVRADYPADVEAFKAILEQNMKNSNIGEPPENGGEYTQERLSRLFDKSRKPENVLKVFMGWLLLNSENFDKSMKEMRTPGSPLRQFYENGKRAFAGKVNFEDLDKLFNK